VAAPLALVAPIVVAVPLVVIVTALGALGMYWFANWLADAFGVGLRKVPGLGGVVNRVARRLRIRAWQFARDPVVSVSNWLSTWRQAIEDFVLALNGFAAATAHGFDAVLTHPQWGIFSNLQPRLNNQDRRLDTIEAADPPQTRRDLIRLSGQLLDPETGYIKVLEGRVGRHEVRIEVMEAADPPQTRRDLTRLAAQLYHPETGDVKVLDRRLTEHHVRIRDVELTQPAQTRTIAIHGAELATEAAAVTRPIAAAIPLALLAPTMRTLLDNEPKMRRFCSMPVDEFDDFMGFLGPIPSLGAIREAVRGAAGFTDELAGLLRAPLGR
jgi:hypothetical protein